MKITLRHTIIFSAMVGGLSVGAFWAGFHQGQRSPVTAGVGGVSGAKGRTGSARIAAVMSAELPPGALSVNDFLHGPIHPDSDLLARWAKGLSLPECVEAINALQSQPAGQPRDDVLKAVVNAWAERDPKGMLAAVGNISVPKFREPGVDSALKALAATNPKEALDWIRDNSLDVSNGDLGKRLAAAFNSFGAANPQAALDAAMSLSLEGRNSGQLQVRAVEGIAEGLSNQGRFADAVALFNGNAISNKLQADALTRVADIWGAVAPQDAANWVSGLNNPSLVNDIGQSLTDAWASSDPAAAAKWAAQMDQQIATSAAAAKAGGNGNGNGNNNGESLLTNAMDIWTKYDLNAAGQFLNQLPASTAKDSAVASFASKAAQTDPASAMSWATSIADPKAQQQAVQQVAKQWAKSDPAALTQFLSTTTALTDAQIQAAAAAAQKPAAGKGQGQGQNSQN